ncbi:MAG: phosphoribosyl-ATP diphosphatase [Pseudomonadota bacterium]
MKKPGDIKGQEIRALEILLRLRNVIRDRAAAGAQPSYTAKLLAGAPQLPARKLAEEAVELALAAVGGVKSEIAAEAADLLYHLLVLLQSADVPLEDVCAILESREGISGITEKAGRKK